MTVLMHFCLFPTSLEVSSKRQAALSYSTLVRSTRANLELGVEDANGFRSK